MLLLIGLLACGDPCRDAGTICTVAGDGLAGYNGDAVPLDEARLYFPTDVTARPGTDELYVTDWNNEKIRRIGDGVISAAVGADLPGDGAPGGGDRVDPGAPGTATSLNHPVQSEFGPDGRLYISAWHNHKIRRWDPEIDAVRIVVANTDPDDGNGANAGFGGDGGLAEDALVWFPSSIAFAPDGSYYFVDQKNLRIRHVDLDGMIDTVCGCGDPGLIDGMPLEATFQFSEDPTSLQPVPGGAVETDADGIIYVADTWNHAIRRVDLEAGTVETIAGTGQPGYTGDGGAAVDAQIYAPVDVELGPDGRLYVADTQNHVIRAIDLEDGSIETVAGTGEEGMGEDGVLATESALNRPYGIEFAADGALLVADTYNSKIRRVTP